MAAAGPAPASTFAPTIAAPAPNSARRDAFTPEIDAEVAVEGDYREVGARILQRFFRAKQQGAAWRELLANVPKLRQEYIDEAALRAGAASNPLYSDGMLAAREKLRHDPLVVQALDKAWETLLPPGRTVLARKAYYTMVTKRSSLPCRVCAPRRLRSRRRDVRLARRVHAHSRSRASSSWC
jgi:hypothetical protein